MVAGCTALTNRPRSEDLRNGPCGFVTHFPLHSEICGDPCGASVRTTGKDGAFHTLYLCKFHRALCLSNEWNLIGRLDTNSGHRCGTEFDPLEIFLCSVREPSNNELQRRENPRGTVHKP